MRYKLPLVVALFLSVITAVNAQVKFNFNGLGRAIVSSNDLTQNNLSHTDTVSNTRSIGGYGLFDLQPNLSISNNIKVQTILRLRNPFGSFFGQAATLNFRQFNISGTIARKVKFEIGDIYFGSEYSKYTMYNPEDMYASFESDIFKERRSILQYEAFVVDNNWRLQGLNLGTDFAFDSGSVVSKIGIRAFGVRTNPTNDKNVPDRIMVGGRVTVVNDKYLTLGVTSINLLDVTMRTGNTNFKEEYKYSNNVISVDGKFKYVHNVFNVQLSGEFGISKFAYEEELTKIKVTDQLPNYFYDISLCGGINPIMSKIFFTYKYVGPDYNSPTAQTSRLDMVKDPSLVPDYNDNNSKRPQALWDRFTDETLYLTSVKPVLYTFNPIYNNLNPYGPATPNRTGITVGAKADTSLTQKGINYLFKYDMYNEVLGERTSSKRGYSVITAGISADIKQLLGLDRSWVAVSYGYRNESTTRTGDAPVDLKTGMHDIGIRFELIKKFDIFGGIKMFSAAGNEYLSSRDNFNQVDNSVTSDTKYDISENIYSFGARFRFLENSYLSANYNIIGYKDKINTINDYNMNQFFVNFTLKF